MTVRRTHDIILAGTKMSRRFLIMETENRKIIFIRFCTMMAALVVTIGLVGCRRDGASDSGVERA